MEDLPPYFPNFVHNKCRLKIQRRLKFIKQEKRNKRSVDPWSLPDFPNPKRKMCGFCRVIRDIPHNSLTCPLRLAKENNVRRRPKKPLMDLVDRKQGKERIKPLIEQFENYCSVNSEKKKDILAFEYRRELFKEGKYKAAKTFESFHINRSHIVIKTLSPRKTASRSVRAGLSWNKSRNAWAYMAQ